MFPVNQQVRIDRLGEGRDRNYEDQRYRASGLNLTIAAIVLWNTVYLNRAVEALKAHGAAISENLTSHLSPLGWVHIGLTGDLRLALRCRNQGRSVPGTSSTQPHLVH